MSNFKKYLEAATTDKWYNIKDKQDLDDLAANYKLGNPLGIKDAEGNVQQINGMTSLEFLNQIKSFPVKVHVINNKIVGYK